MSSDIENKCIKKGVRLTDQRKLVAKVMSESEDHPDVAEKLNSVAIDAFCKLSKNFGFRLIHFSTDYVFDGKKEKPYTEDDTEK